MSTSTPAELIALMNEKKALNTSLIAINVDEIGVQQFRITESTANVASLQATNTGLAQQNVQFDEIIAILQA